MNDPATFGEASAFQLGRTPSQFVHRLRRKQKSSGKRKENKRTRIIVSALMTSLLKDVDRSGGQFYTL